MHEGAKMTGATRMNVATAISVLVILLATLARADTPTIIGLVGAGVIFVTGWGFGFLLESLAKK